MSSNIPNMPNIPFLASGTGPAWLPAAARDARQFAYWGQLITGVMALVALIMAIVSFITFAWPSGIYFLIAMAVLGFLFYMMGKTVFDPLDQGKFREASDMLLVWGFLGLIFMFIAGIFFRFAYVRLQDAFPPQCPQDTTE